MTFRFSTLFTGHSWRIRLADAFALISLHNSQAIVSAGLTVARVALRAVLLYRPAKVDLLHPSTLHFLHQLWQRSHLPKTDLQLKSKMEERCKLCYLMKRHTKMHIKKAHMVQRFAHSPFVLWPLEMMQQIQPSLNTFSSYCPRRWAALSLVLQFVACLLHPHPPVPKVFYGQYLFKIFEYICRDDGCYKGFIGSRIYVILTSKFHL